MHISPRHFATAARALVVVAAAISLGACGGIPHRAWVNGAAMGLNQPLQHRTVRDMSAMRQSYYRAAPLTALSRRGPYTPAFRPRF